MNEEWRDIKDYEGVYKVSDAGRIKSLERTLPRGRYNTTKVWKERIISQQIRNGYCVVYLNKKGKNKTFQVSRLVASAFVDGEEDKLIVNHIDEDKLNNVASNLEWCTQHENVNHSIERLRNSRRSNTGERYISFCKKSKMFVLQIRRSEKSELTFYHKSTYKTLEEAKKQKDLILSEIDFN